MNIKKFKYYRLKVLNWSEERGLFDPEHGATKQSQYLKFLEELGELSKAINRNDKKMIIDSIGDCIITLVNLDYLNEKELYYYDALGNDTDYNQSNTFDYINRIVISLGDMNITEVVNELYGLEKHLKIDFNACLETAYNEIKDRKGKMINRTFVKESDL